MNYIRHDPPYTIKWYDFNGKLATCIEKNNSYEYMEELQAEFEKINPKRTYYIVWVDAK